MASPVERPKLGRPPAATTSLDEGPAQTEPVVKLPNPTLAGNRRSLAGNKQTRSVVGNNDVATHETSTPVVPHPAPNPAQGGKIQINVKSAPPPADSRPDRPVRKTRNQNPLYVDGISMDIRPFTRSDKIWSASAQDLANINNAIALKTRH